MEGKDVDLLFGLDVLKRHQACIDLKRNCLIINDEQIPFLDEHELPRSFMAKDDESQPGPSSPEQGAEIEKSASPVTKHSEQTIKMITDMGISRQEAISALDATGGNPDAAVSLLFQFN